MTQPCPSCGADTHGTRYCTACGAMLGEVVSAFSPAPPAAGTPPPYAPFHQRFFAFFLDGLVIACTALFLALGATASYWLGALRLPEGYWAEGFFLWWMVIAWVLGIAYHTVFLGGGGQTFGKKALGIAVVDAGHRRIGYGRAFLRAIGYEVSSCLFQLGFLWALWDRRRQGWHDKMADTVVVRRDG